MTETATLILRLSGLMQAWSPTRQYGGPLNSGLRPTKSGVLGLCANAQGRQRGDDMSDLAALRFGVRADRPGRLVSDFRTAGGGTMRALAGEWYETQADSRGRAPYAPLAKSWDMVSEGRDPKLDKNPALRPQTILAEADFQAALTGDRELLEEVAQALREPARPMFLGRKALPPSAPLFEELLDGDRHDEWVAGGSDRHVWDEHPDGFAMYENPASGRGFGLARIRWIKPTESECTTTSA